MTETQALRIKQAKLRMKRKMVARVSADYQKKGAQLTGGNVHKMKQVEKTLLTPKQKAHLKWLAEHNRKLKKGV